MRATVLWNWLWARVNLTIQGWLERFIQPRQTFSPQLRLQNLIGP